MGLHRTYHSTTQIKLEWHCEGQHILVGPSVCLCCCSVLQFAPVGGSQKRDFSLSISVSCCEGSHVLNYSFV